MYVRITETYSFYREGKLPALATAGCGCCSDIYEATPKRVNKAIEEIEQFLAELKALRERLSESNAG